MAINRCVDSEPKCTVDKPKPREGDTVTLTCDVTYTPNVSPMVMEWTDGQGRPVPAHSGPPTPGRTTSSISFIAARPAIEPYSCKVTFSRPRDVSPPQYDVTPASNAPEYTFTWTSPGLAVRGWRRKLSLKISFELS